MPFNLLIFPLVGGYYVLVRSIFFTYLHQRIEQQKLIFNSAIAGIGILVISLFLKKILLLISPDLAGFLKSQLPLYYPYSATTVSSFIIAVVGTEASNLIFAKRFKRKCLYFAIDQIGSELEILLRNNVEQEQLVQVTLKNDKFYVGYVVSIPIPHRSNFVVMSPVFGGYRDDRKQLKFTTAYNLVYAEYVSENRATDIRKLSHVHLRMDEIIIANKFDVEMYDKFRKQGVAPA